MDDVTLLGIAPAAGAEALARAMEALPGPPVAVHVAGSIAGLAQPAERARRGLLLARDRAGLLASLAALQRRLEAACVAGPFLPADPGAARLPAAELPGLLAAAAPLLEEALATKGARHQWDVVIRWNAEAVVARHRAELQGLAGAALARAIRATLVGEREMRAAALRAALRGAVLAIAEPLPVEEDAATGLTVLVPAGGEAAIEAALGTLPEEASRDAAADLRGPLPPLGFAALRLAEVPAGAVERAWSLLGLPEAAPEALPASDLTRHWRGIAAKLHPDRAGAAADPARFAEAHEAYRLLRSLAGEAPLDRVLLAARARRRLVLPEAA